MTSVDLIARRGDVTQEKFAEAMGVCQKTIASWEIGWKPVPKLLPVLEVAYGLSEEEAVDYWYTVQRGTPPRGELEPGITAYDLADWCHGLKLERGSKLYQAVRNACSGECILQPRWLAELAERLGRSERSVAMASWRVYKRRRLKGGMWL